MRSEAQIKGALQDLDDAIQLGYDLRVADRLKNLEAFAEILRWVLEELPSSEETGDKNE